jgi:hypothetical protein
VCDLGYPSRTRTYETGEISVRWDYTLLEYPRLVPGYFFDGYMIQSFPSNGVSDIQFNREPGLYTWKRVRLFALEFENQPDASGWIDFTLDSVDIGYELSGGWLSAENFHLD